MSYPGNENAALEQQLAEARRENVRFENAHKILLAEIERQKRQVDRLTAYISATALAGYRCAPCAERLIAEPSKPAHEREPPHCSTCSCGR